MTIHSQLTNRFEPVYIDKWKPDVNTCIADDETVIEIGRYFYALGAKVDDDWPKDFREYAGEQEKPIGNTLKEYREPSNSKVTNFLLEL